MRVLFRNGIINVLIDYFDILLTYKSWIFRRYSKRFDNSVFILLLFWFWKLRQFISGLFVVFYGAIHRYLHRIPFLLNLPISDAILRLFTRNGVVWPLVIGGDWVQINIFSCFVFDNLSHTVILTLFFILLIFILNPLDLPLQLFDLLNIIKILNLLWVKKLGLEVVVRH